ncbi:MAG: lasso peptide biosynthesis B2 protein [Deinococcota bacterium]|jgi:hypothetical protein|nr:lasso peptide biosynthesis B2 protein [Deinococcota bacterium]
MPAYWPRLAKRLHGLRRLRSPGDALLLVRIFLFAAFVPLLLRLKLPTLLSLLEPKRARPLPDPAKTAKIVRYVQAVLRFGKPVVRPGCLTRGLTLFYFLRRAGVEVALCFGTGAPEGKFEGHCWLVKEGEPFLEGVDPRPVFTEIYRSGPRLAGPQV